jgi:nucleotide-binding universal stress UspA family protein
MLRWDLLPGDGEEKICLTQLMTRTTDTTTTTASNAAKNAAESFAGTIVVGVDGSPGSINALQWAKAEADLRGLRVRAIHTWEMPILYGPEAGMWLSSDQVELEAEKILSDTIGKAFPDAKEREGIEAFNVCGGAADQLCKASNSAAMVVVGARGHGGFLGLLMGSVATQVVHHATCPVVVVPGADR